MHSTALTLEVPSDIILQVAQIQISKKLVEKNDILLNKTWIKTHSSDCSINICALIKDMS